MTCARSLTADHRHRLVCRPSTPGTYTFHLENTFANVLASVSFTVEGAIRGDLNCDGYVTAADIPHFVQALIDPAGYDADHDGDPYPVCQRVRADISEDTREDGTDIQGFVNALLASPWMLACGLFLVTLLFDKQARPPVGTAEYLRAGGRLSWPSLRPRSVVTAFEIAADNRWRSDSPAALSV